MFLINNISLLDPEVWDALQARKQASTVEGNMGDISGGKKYEEMKEFVKNGNLTMVANTDGVQLFKSSSVSLWPVWIVINELPMGMRYNYNVANYQNSRGPEGYIGRQ